MKKVVLSKSWGWIIITLLVLLDALLDMLFAKGKGLENNVLKPITDIFGITSPLLAVPFVLILFYFVVKGGAWLAEKVDKVKVKAEELVLTTLVIVYGIFDIWLLSVYLFDFRLFKSHYYLIPILILAGIIYEWWAERKLK